MNYYDSTYKRAQKKQNAQNRCSEVISIDSLTDTIKSMNRNLEEHKKTCVAKPGNCPFEKKTTKEVEKIEEKNDKIDSLSEIKHNDSDIPYGPTDYKNIDAWVNAAHGEERKRRVEIVSGFETNGSNFYSYSPNDNHNSKKQMDKILSFECMKNADADKVFCLEAYIFSDTTPDGKGSAGKEYDISERQDGAIELKRIKSEALTGTDFKNMDHWKTNDVSEDEVKKAIIDMYQKKYAETEKLGGYDDIEVEIEDFGIEESYFYEPFEETPSFKEYKASPVVVIYPNGYNKSEYEQGITKKAHMFHINNPKWKRLPTGGYIDCNSGNISDLERYMSTLKQDGLIPQNATASLNKDGKGIIKWNSESEKHVDTSVDKMNQIKFLLSDSKKDKQSGNWSMPSQETINKIMEMLNK